VEPVIEKPSTGAVDSMMDPAKADAAEVYLPLMKTNEPSDVSAAATTATWRTIVSEGFEGVWPENSPCWYVIDYDDGDLAGNDNWDDTSTKFKTGGWSAHPTDGVRPYPDKMTSIMRCGPVSLVGALDARLKFYYFLDSEAGFDFFKWGYSCNGTNGWTEKSVSGNKSWTAVTESLKSCKGKSTVYVQFTFTSDYSVTDNGVWVDDIRIEKYQ
jgi:hypothetical protein